jgi:hypothetical protein
MVFEKHLQNCMRFIKLTSLHFSSAWSPHSMQYHDIPCCIHRTRCSGSAKHAARQCHCEISSSRDMRSATQLRRSCTHTLNRSPVSTRGSGVLALRYLSTHEVWGANRGSASKGASRTPGKWVTPLKCAKTTRTSSRNSSRSVSCLLLHNEENVAGCSTTASSVVTAWEHS